jgi:hypothetical protein
MKKLDDLDIAFGSGAVFGAGITVLCVSTATLIKYYKRFKSVKAAQKRLFEEIGRKLENEENESY